MKLQHLLKTVGWVQILARRIDGENYLLAAGAEEQPTLSPNKGRSGLLSEQERKDLLLIRDGRRCQGCGWEPPYEDYLQVDHLRPRSNGGAHVVENRTLLCDPCNRLKSNKLTLAELQEKRIAEGRMDCWKECARDAPNAGSLRFGVVNVPEWGGTVRVRSLTGRERCLLWRQRRNPRKEFSDGGVYAMAVSFAIVDEDGDRVFNNQDIPGLGRKSAIPIMRIYRAILRLSTAMGYPDPMPTHQKQTEPMKHRSNSGQDSGAMRRPTTCVDQVAGASPSRRTA